MDVHDNKFNLLSDREEKKFAMHCLLKLQLLITPIYCNSPLTVRFLLSLEMKIISYGNGNNKLLPPGCHWGNKMSDFGC